MSFLNYITPKKSHLMDCVYKKKLSSDFANLIYLRTIKGLGDKASKIKIFFLRIVLFFTLLLVATTFPFLVVFCFIYLNINSGNNTGLGEGQLLVKGKLFFCRSKATFDKIESLLKSDDLLIVESTLFDAPVAQIKIFSKNNLNNLKAYFHCIFIILRDLVQVFKDINRILGLSIFGYTNLMQLILRIVPRMLHKAAYEASLSLLIEKNRSQTRGKCFYTGNKDDQLAALENRIALNEHLHLECLPHGLEYGFKLPNQMPGKRVYCYTENAANVLNRLYDSGKYCFDPKVAQKMLCNEQARKVKDENRGIVVFSSPREREIINSILKKLNSEGLEYRLKLHPLDSFDFYATNCSKELLVEVAPLNSICISPPSTILLQAIYSSGKPICIFKDVEHRDNTELHFPSLVDSNIITADLESEFKFEELIR